MCRYLIIGRIQENKSVMSGRSTRVKSDVRTFFHNSRILVSKNNIKKLAISDLSVYLQIELA